MCTLCFNIALNTRIIKILNMHAINGTSPHLQPTKTKAT